MSTLFAPFREFDPVVRPRPVARPSAPTAPFDAVRDDDGVTLSFDLPGVDPASIDLSVEGKVLTLSAERTWSVPEGSSALVRERRHGSVTRRLRLSDALDASGIAASYDNGVLHVRIPVSAAAQPHRIEVEVGSAPVLESAAVEAGESASEN